MYLDKDYILNSLTNEDVINICTYLGSEGHKVDSNGNLIFQTICHNAEGGSYKLYYYPDTKLFHCYSGCQNSFSIVELVIRANRTKGKIFTFYKALKLIGVLSGKLKEIEPEKQEVTHKIDWSWLSQFKNLQSKHKSIPVLSDINENILDMFCYIPHESWLNDHVTEEALNRFEIGYYGLTNQIVIPHRDINERLIGIRGRFLDDQDIKAVGKYVPLYINGKFLSHSLGSNLYGIHVSKNAIRKTGKCLLVESEKACLQNYSYFGESSFAAAVCGSNITNTQMRLLLETLKVQEVIIGFDKEYEQADTYEAEAYYNKLLNKAAMFMPYCKVSLLMDRQGLLKRKDSPTDQGKAILLKLLEDKITVTNEDIKNIQVKRI